MNQRNSAPDQDSGKLLECIEITTSPRPEFAVIWMHGLGADGNDFAAIVPGLGLPDSLAVRFVFPHAQMRPITINGGMVMRAWYDITDLNASRGHDEAGIKHSTAKIRALIDREVKRGIAPEKVVVAGFSQGGAMALHAGLRYPHKLAGIMALSAYLLFPERLPAEQAQANADTMIFIGHGSQDPMVPFAMGQASHAALSKQNHPTQWHSYPIPHAVSQPEVADIGRWLTACFQPPVNRS